MRSKVSTGFETAAHFGSQGMFGGNIKQKAELKKGLHLVQGEGVTAGSWIAQTSVALACLVSTGLFSF